MKEKKLLILLASVCLVLALTALPFMVACAKPAPAPAPAKPIELSFGSLFPSVSAEATKAYGPWIAELEKRTGGRVKITSHWGASLFPPPEAFDACKGGIADIAEVDPTANPGRFLTWDILHQNYPSTEYSRFGHIIHELSQKFPQMEAEFAGTKFLYGWSMGPNLVQTTKKPVHKLEDLKGLKLAGIGEMMPRAGKELGYTSVTMMPGEWSMALEKGVVDGVTLTSVSTRAHALTDSIRYITRAAVCGSIFVVVMNEDKWNSLPPDIQQIFDEVNGEWVRDLFDRTWHELWEGELQAYPEEFGIEVIELSPEELARWDEKIKNYHNIFVDALEAKGLPGRELLDEYHRLVKMYPMD